MEVGSRLQPQAYTYLLDVLRFLGSNRVILNPERTRCCAKVPITLPKSSEDPNEAELFEYQISNHSKLSFLLWIALPCDFGRVTELSATRLVLEIASGLLINDRYKNIKE